MEIRVYANLFASRGRRARLSLGIWGRLFGRTVWGISRRGTPWFKIRL